MNSEVLEHALSKGYPLRLHEDELRAMQNRLTWALKPAGSAWKIVHEHTSAPMGFKDSKVILQREKAS
jgi:hypothetical protein